MTITLTREEAQQVLDALNSCDETWVYDGEWETIVDQYDHELVAKATELFRAKLAQPEPAKSSTEPWAGVDFDIKTAPPQREWQGLTDDEKEDVLKGSKNAYDAIERIEAKLKEKNT
jgi:hypothetical protein